MCSQGCSAPCANAVGFLPSVAYKALLVTAPFLSRNEKRSLSPSPPDPCTNGCNGEWMFSFQLPSIASYLIVPSSQAQVSRLKAWQLPASDLQPSSTSASH